MGRRKGGAPREHLWVKGRSGNPAGRPKGNRARISENFLRDLNDAWIDQGKSALARGFEEDPIKMIQIVADLLPKEATLNVDNTITVQSRPLSELEGWLNELATSRTPAIDAEFSEDRSLLPTSLCSEQTGH